MNEPALDTIKPYPQELKDLWKAAVLAQLRGAGLSDISTMALRADAVVGEFLRRCEEEHLAKARARWADLIDRATHNDDEEAK